jgi:hypothetical protein
MGNYYTIPDPKERDNDTVEKMIVNLEYAIKNGKLKDMKSILSNLKLSINDDFPLYTRDTATLGAYAYAVETNSKKAADSLLKAAVKKNYGFIVFPILILTNNLSKPAFEAIMNNILLVNDTWKIETAETLEILFKKIPKETNQAIVNGRVNKYAVGEDRINSAVVVIQNGNAEAIVAALNTFYGIDFIKNYTLSTEKLNLLTDALSNRNSDIQTTVMNNYFYNTAAPALSIEYIEDIYMNGNFDITSMTHYIDGMLRHTGIPNTISTIANVTNEELRGKLIGVDNDLAKLIIKKHTKLLPQLMKDSFLF